jgi:formamidopyrimidine-DNA glycosylase
MPELPEVETVRRDLARVYLGHRLERIVVTGRRTVRRHPPDLLKSLAGRTLVATGRHGKYLLLEWDDGQVLVVHLRMSGQLLAAQRGGPLAPHTHAVLTFEGAGELRFVDPRTFGELFLATPLQLAGPTGSHLPLVASRLAELDHLGPDALDADVARFRDTLAGRRAPLKSLLVDQRVIAGVGNIYADEICFAARLRPDRPGGSLKRPELKRLTDATHTLLQSAIDARGSSLVDEGYRDLQGAPGRFQLKHKVYGRQGQKCGSCGRDIERAHFGAKSAFLCRKCQK